MSNIIPITPMTKINLSINRLKVLTLSLCLFNCSTQGYEEEPLTQMQPEIVEEPLQFKTPRQLENYLSSFLSDIATQARLNNLILDDQEKFIELGRSALLSRGDGSENYLLNYNEAAYFTPSSAYTESTRQKEELGLLGVAGDHLDLSIIEMPEAKESVDLIADIIESSLDMTAEELTVFLDDKITEFSINYHENELAVDLIVVLKVITDFVIQNPDLVSESFPSGRKITDDCKFWVAGGIVVGGIAFGALGCFAGLIVATAPGCFVGATKGATWGGVIGGAAVGGLASWITNKDCQKLAQDGNGIGSKGDNFIPRRAIIQHRNYIRNILF